MPILYGMEASAPYRSVLLIAKALNLKLELKNVDLMKNEHKSDAYLKMNPNHTVPVLDDDGFILTESRAIMTYLVEKYGKDDKLYPKDVKTRAKIDSILQFELGTFYPSFAYVYYPVMMMGKPLDTKLEDHYKDRLGVLNTILGSHPYMAGDKLTIADYSMVNTLTSPELVLGNAFTEYPNVAKYYAKVKKEIPFYDEVTKTGLEEQKAFYLSKWKK